MGRRRSRGDGFNTPFAKAKLPRPTPKPGSQESRPKRLDSSNKTDAQLFAEAVDGAAPLDDQRGRVEPAKREVPAIPDDEQLALLELQSLVEGKGTFEIIDSEEALSGKAPGVSNDILERLRRGHFSFRRHIDLHGHSRDEAKEIVTRFVSEARRDGERCVLVITGRGKSSPTGVSVLREALPRWLSRAPLSSHVLAFASARHVDGGAGAFYVLLRRPGVRPFGIP